MEKDFVGNIVYQLVLIFDTAKKEKESVTGILILFCDETEHLRNLQS